jgi:hypothetical protein
MALFCSGGMVPRASDSESDEEALLAAEEVAVVAVEADARESSFDWPKDAAPPAEVGVADEFAARSSSSSSSRDDSISSTASVNNFITSSTASNFTKGTFFKALSTHTHMQWHRERDSESHGQQDCRSAGG